MVGSLRSIITVNDRKSKEILKFFFRLTMKKVENWVCDFYLTYNKVLRNSFF